MLVKTLASNFIDLPNLALDTYSIFGYQLNINHLTPLTNDANIQMDELAYAHFKSYWP